MMNEERYLALEAENARLREAMRRDSLTQLWNTATCKERVTQALERDAGAMLLVDINNFRQINDRFGHLVGDKILCKLAGLLSGMFFRTDTVGRVGGDEFLIYIAHPCDVSFLKERVRQIKDRLRGEVFTEIPDTPVRIAIGYSVASKEDTFETIYDRANRMLQGLKVEAKDIQHHLRHTIEADIRALRAQLREEEEPAGAMQLEYEEFEHIYRYVERTLRRTGQNACVILLTLTDSCGSMPPFLGRETMMEILRQSIHDTLRISDTYTQYSSSQFLIMGSGAEVSNSDIIAKRVRECFYDRLGIREGEFLVHACFPMEPADRRIR